MPDQAEWSGSVFECGARELAGRIDVKLPITKSLEMREVNLMKSKFFEALEKTKRRTMDSGLGRDNEKKRETSTSCSLNNHYFIDSIDFVNSSYEMSLFKQSNVQDRQFRYEC